MPDPDKYNLNFRPISYWGPQEVETHVGARVKGELRRQQVIRDLEENHADHEIISESLTEEHRRAAGAVHPWLMGGEYLSDLKPNEVEIARVVMQSTTMDVISIRARKTKNRIIYKIIDEYPEDEFQNYSLTKKTSKQPLTLGELIKLIDNAVEDGLVGSGRNWHFEEGTPADEIYDFETASSAFYAELSEWYDQTNEEWLHEKQSEEAQAELEEAQAELEAEYEERYLAGEPSTNFEEDHWRKTHSERLHGKLESVYESRYWGGESTRTSEEEVWRNFHQNRLEFKKKIQDHVSKCEWQKPRAPFGYGGFAAQKGYQSIRSYVEKYLESEDVLPTGIHLIDGIEVKFHS